MPMQTTNTYYNISDKFDWLFCSSSFLAAAVFGVDVLCSVMFCFVLFCCLFVCLFSACCYFLSFFVLFFSNNILFLLVIVFFLLLLLLLLLLFNFKFCVLCFRSRSFSLSPFSTLVSIFCMPSYFSLSFFLLARITSCLAATVFKRLN